MKRVRLNDKWVAVAAPLLAPLVPLLAAALLLMPAAGAQTPWPDKPVSLIVPWASSAHRASQPRPREAEAHLSVIWS